MEDIRTASLVSLKLIADDISEAESAASSWIRENLPNESDTDALWILQHQAREDHATWWLGAIRKGLTSAFNNLSTTWASALWRWWSAAPASVAWTQSLIKSSAKTEATLLAHAPLNLTEELRTNLTIFCVKRRLPKLLARVLHGLDSFTEAVRRLRDNIKTSERGLDVLLQGYPREEVVLEAANRGWQPLVNRVVKWTINDPVLLDSIHFNSPEAIGFLATHLDEGGHLPLTAIDNNCIQRVLQGCINGEEASTEIARHLGSHGAGFALTFSQQDELWEALRSAGCEALISATAAVWLKVFIANEQPSKPGSVLTAAIGKRAREAFRGGPVRRVIDYLITFSEVPENEVVQWLTDERFSWQLGDDERLAELLLARDWRSAARSFRYSWKNEELKAVAWYARELLNLWDGFWSTPRGPAANVGSNTEAASVKKNSEIKILLLAANPLCSDRLAIDEEVRSIEQILRASKLRDTVHIRSQWATRPGDLQQALLEEQPTVVHFSGHGGGTTGIVLHSDANDTESLVSSSALAHLFKVLKDNIRVVVLNACYSGEQATLIVEEIDFVVGMSDSIGDEGARVFAAAFYRGLAFGRVVQTAFDLGVNELKLKGLQSDEDVPVLLTRAGVNPSTEVLAPVYP